MVGLAWLQWVYLFFWLCFLAFLTIGGYFMFRKFLRTLPRDDGRSILDWQEYYIKETIHLWKQEHKELLNDLVKPVPSPFRNTVKRKIAGKIGELALKDQIKALTEEYIIRGYILATPRRDHKWLVKTLKARKINLSKYRNLIK
ncbi:DUF2621 family protein [Thermoactinomyces mirandus]|uniref:DUF2621 family protein n=1 Tax=Thermoactinomyces mirandus TaxID=2756294 RepID=A0A7W1XVD1_9BACL|nr:DUF2621 family protein [Thermoactinomyces mirandus]MBA4603767.1 DUF2621 family protein [Thermoactinomyces mirandus]